MAYCDYGGMAYKNGLPMNDRCDAQSPDVGCGGRVIFHTLLGSGPVKVGLFKQTSVTTVVNGKEVRHDTPDFNADFPQSLAFSIEGTLVEIQWVHTDNYYQFVKVTEPGGTVWTGVSGYGVFRDDDEEYGYGYSTSNVLNTLHELFPN